MSYQDPFEIAKSRIIEPKQISSPILLVERLISEFDENAEVGILYQREELQSCIAVLNAKNLDWSEFNVQFQQLKSLGLICSVLIDSFPYAEKAYDEALDSTGLKTLLKKSAYALESAEKKWPANGAYLAHKCQQHRAVVGSMDDEVVQKFFRSIDLNIGGGTWKAINTLSEIIDGEDSRELSSTEDSINQSSDDAESLHYSFELSESDTIAAELEAVFGILPSLRAASPLDANFVYEKAISLIQNLPKWKESKINQNFDEDKEEFSTEFINQSSSLFQVLLRISTDLAEFGNFTDAIKVSKSLVDILSVDSFDSLDEYVTIPKILSGVQLLAELGVKQSIPLALELYQDSSHSLERCLQQIQSEADIDTKAEILGGIVKGWLDVWSGLENRIRPLICPCDLQTGLSITRIANELLESDELKFAKTMGIGFSSEGSSNNANFQEAFAILHHHLSSFYRILDKRELSAVHHSKFSSMAIDILGRHGLSAVDFDEEGPATLFLDCLEELIAQKQIQQARDFAEKFDCALFNAATNLDFAHFSANPSREEEEEDDDDDGYQSHASEDVKERFMILCAEAGFLDLACSTYQGLIDAATDATDRFLFLTSLAKGLRTTIAN